ncbi:thiolase family protein [Mycobacteroides immunogenum]|uniref:Acetyl-CoA acetyltransferase n=1 Tax=Mycobacteroides immunogenum TaxID=83262 RepID=A0A7V8LR08_9MYCO|nr:thiolase family protein [Mycobacteroides immunogenum]AMT72004.1 acetyl-CoA acetyltransferase [Mycobacteroides immunogenum]ANO05134.1 acetyl-CoA acetyltransferase [Mycobacteroides immunogenum]KIU40193.1 acetyl-CoA acetyltransferase [Mycobacteroides immunogenum]KPG13694.1 acetyl-CoA acetyltransferase [Mycobacteroides immunogenum]KPG14386.1 acetyl-CoA acetyltransferase [Mycobacteroides immunogenum]
MRDAVIVDAVRTPVGKGKPGGALSGVHPVDLHAHAIRALVERTGIDPALVDDVISGAVGQVGEQSSNTARWAALAAGLPETVPAVTVDRQCGSSQQAIHFAAQGVIAGAYDMVIASGIESMSRVPMGSQSLGKDFFGSEVAARYPDGLVPQGISAELVAAKWNLSREQLDTFAAESHRRAAQAWAEGRFARDVTPIKAPNVNGELVEVSSDESVRPSTTVEVLAGLKPAFRNELWEQRFPQLEWRVTAGNSSPINDGASAVLITSGETAQRLGLTPRARVHSVAVVGDDPLYMLTGIIPATAKVLDRAGLSLADIDAFEVNEAFASVVLAWQAETGADLSKVNINGGATAIGHPLGASGGRLMTTLVSVLEQTDGRYGLQTMCEAGGLANATIIERL